LPGGVGTMDELFEAWSWTQACLQRKPSGLLNVNGYYDAMVAFLDHSVQEGFITPASRGILRVGSDLGPLLDALTVPCPA
jgi:uncharacterized protein (TIGR00730 family)